MPLRLGQNTAFLSYVISKITPSAAHYRNNLGSKRDLSVFFLRNKGVKMTNTTHYPEVLLRKWTVIALERLIWEWKYFVLCLSYYICIRQVDLIKDN